MTAETISNSVDREPELLGQTVVVIGGSAEIGLETARKAREGADVVLTGLNLGDPWNRCITATTISRGVPLVTKDVETARAGAGKVIW